jgi:hypothetical protein
MRHNLPRKEFHVFHRQVMGYVAELERSEQEARVTVLAGPSFPPVGRSHRAAPQPV